MFNDRPEVWTLIFSVDDCAEVHIFKTDGNPQDAAFEIIRQFPHLRLIAAADGALRVFPKDNSRTYECGLLDWP